MCSNKRYVFVHENANSEPKFCVRMSTTKRIIKKQLMMGVNHQSVLFAKFETYLMARSKENIDTSKWVDDYADLLYSFALARVDDADLAKDFVQDTFIAGLKALEKFEGKSSVKTWLFSILKRKIIDHYRQQVARKTKPLSSFFREKGRVGHWVPEAAPKGNFADFEEDIENRELQEAITNCIALLPAKWKGVVIDKLVEEKDTEEVCKENDVSASNLWVIVHRAKLQLRECLEKKWVNT